MADNRFFLLGRDMAVDLGTANTWSTCAAGASS